MYPESWCEATRQQSRLRDLLKVSLAPGARLQSVSSPPCGEGSCKAKRKRKRKSHIDRHSDGACDENCNCNRSTSTGTNTDAEVRVTVIVMWCWVGFMWKTRSESNRHSNRDSKRHSNSNSKSKSKGDGASNPRPEPESHSPIHSQRAHRRKHGSRRARPLCTTAAAREAATMPRARYFLIDGGLY